MRSSELAMVCMIDLHSDSSLPMLCEQEQHIVDAHRSTTNIYCTAPRHNIDLGVLGEGAYFPTHIDSMGIVCPTLMVHR